MTEPEDAPAPQIIIVRRKSGDGDEGHHGGVWKIAYADFMTAMMALFLVLWLVNAANEELKASVASYFNPIKLTDMVPQQKGLLTEDPAARTKGVAETDKVNLDQGTTGADGPSEKKAHSADQDEGRKIAANPATVLELLGIGSRAEGPDVEDPTRGAMTRESAVSGQSFIDPFNPLKPGEGTLKLDSSDPIASSDAGAQQPEDGGLRPGARTARARGEGPGDEPAVAENGRDGRSQAEDARPGVAVPQSDALQSTKKALEATARELESAIVAAVGRDRMAETGVPGVNVEVVEGEVVIQLTDKTNFAMFESGSADPVPELQEFLRAIVTVIAKRPQGLVIRGHTDARPFRTTTRSDNWRLAMARAQTAYLLLRDAGLAIDRFARIEAYAATKPKVVTDPDAPANRRIELVLVEAVTR
jgi:chemotaxis protein MotB